MEENIRIRELLRDAIKLLCKNGLKFNAEFSVEGLLGITIDNQDIVLVNINETVLQPAAQESIQIVHTETSFVKSSHCASSPIPVSYSPYNKNSFGRRAMGYSHSGVRKVKQKRIEGVRNRPSKVWLTDVSESSQNSSNEQSIHCPVQVEKSGLNDFKRSSEPTVSMLTAFSESQTGTSGKEALQRLVDCVGRINDESHVNSKSDTGSDTMQDQYSEDEQFCVKEEVLSDLEIVPNEEVGIVENRHFDKRLKLSEDRSNFKSKKDSGKVYSDRISDATSSGSKISDREDSPSWSWYSTPEGAGKAVFPSCDSSSPSQVAPGGLIASPFGLASPELPRMPPNFKLCGRSGFEARDQLKELDCECAGMRAAGCIIIPRILCRAKGFKVGHVMNAMRTMTRRREDPLYVGEYKQISGNMKTFYKCPPDLIKDEALAKYELTRDTYTALYYQNPRPKLGGPVNWANYVETLMRHMPLGPQHYPIDAMGLTDTELRDMQAKQVTCPHLDNSDYYACIHSVQ